MHFLLIEVLLDNLLEAGKTVSGRIRRSDKIRTIFPDTLLSGRLVIGVTRLHKFWNLYLPSEAGLRWLIEMWRISIFLVEKAKGNSSIWTDVRMHWSQAISCSFCDRIVGYLLRRVYYDVWKLGSDASRTLCYQCALDDVGRVLRAVCSRRSVLSVLYKSRAIERRDSYQLVILKRYPKINHTICKRGSQISLTTYRSYQSLFYMKL